MNEQFENERLVTLLKNTEFVEKLVKCKKTVEAQKLFAEHDCELSTEEITSLCEGMKIILQKKIANDGELSEKDLEEISGGIVVPLMPILWGTSEAIIAALVATGVISGTTITITGILSDWEW